MLRTLKLSVLFGSVIFSLQSYADTAHCRDNEGLTPLHRAAGAGNSILVSQLLNEGADVFALDSKMAISALHKAVYSGNPETVRRLLLAGAPLNLQSPSNGNTALHDAIYFRHGNDLNLIKALLDFKPSLSIRNRAGLTPIESAKVLKALDIVGVLESYETNRQSKQSRLLMDIVKKNDPQAIQTLLKEIPTSILKEADSQGFTPLLWASREGFVEIVRLLLNAGADPNQNDEWMGANSGHKAAFWGRANVIQLLIAGGLNLDAQGKYNGYTPLHDAVAGAHLETIKVLLAAGAKTTIQGHDGKTAYDLARDGKRADVLALFTMK